MSQDLEKNGIISGTYIVIAEKKVDPPKDITFPFDCVEIAMVATSNQMTKIDAFTFTGLNGLLILNLESNQIHSFANNPVISLSISLMIPGLIHLLMYIK